ncbi:MAG TPA: DUF1178 family protein [Dongiaceae bacterium]
MILFDLRCTRDHVFEAWFPNNAAYERQAKAGAVACPSCGSRKIEKAPMAPRIGKAAKAGVPAVAAEHAEIRQQLTELRAKIEANCDYVGDKFAEEARRIHYGETERRDIYGETSDDEAKELSDEGVKFSRVPWLPRQDS